jgi:hypothetical protein
MKSTQFIALISIILCSFMLVIFVEVVRGSIRIPSSIWLSSLLVSSVFMAAYYWLERKGKTNILLSNKDYLALKLLLGMLIIAVAYTYSLSAAALLLMVCGLASIVDYAYRYSHFASKNKPYSW